MTDPWLEPPDGAAAATAAALMAAIPRIETDRCILGAPRIEHYEAYATIFRSDRWPHKEHDASDARIWHDFCQMACGWLLRGTGLWSVTDPQGTLLGFVTLNHEWGDAEVEIGWMLTEAAEGRGLAHEAVAAALGHAFGALGMASVVSYVAPVNARSIRLAERLGARASGTENGSLVFRHLPPGPAARTDTAPTEDRHDTDVVPTDRKAPS